MSSALRWVYRNSTVSADQGHFRDRQTTLEEAAHGFMAEIVKVKVLHSCPSHNSLPGQLDRFDTDREYPFLAICESFQLLQQ
jgi:hypothetical protein